MDSAVSIIIPTFNRADLLTQTINSALGQTFVGIEIVVVDDGSTDKTREILDPFIANKQIEYVFQENRGRSEARNTGMRSSSGSLLMFLDSDDVLYPNAIEILVRSASSFPDSGLVAGKREFIDESGVGIVTKDPVEFEHEIFSEFVHIRKIRKLFFPPSTYIVRREVAEKAGGFEAALEPAEDFDFFVKCCDVSPITVLSSFIVRMRRHPGNTPDRAIREASLKIGRKNFDRLVKDPNPCDVVLLHRLKSEWLVRMGDDLYSLERELSALKHYCDSVLISPKLIFDPHVSRQIAASILPTGLKNFLKSLV
jgi:glycosyltransferase involved in cell wall biosynthesis